MKLGYEAEHDAETIADAEEIYGVPDLKKIPGLSESSVVTVEQVIRYSTADNVLLGDSLVRRVDITYTWDPEQPETWQVRGFLSISKRTPQGKWASGMNRKSGVGAHLFIRHIAEKSGILNIDPLEVF